MKQSLLLILALYCLASSFAQSISSRDSVRQAKKDSTLRATIHEDSLKVEKQFAMAEKWDRMLDKAMYPQIKSGDMSGVIPVSNVTEIPDPNMDYKLLFEVVTSNPDSMKGELDQALVEVGRVINLHVASGIPVKRILPVIVVHGPALFSLFNDEAYHKKFGMDNPNLKLVKELETINARFIACGQAEAFLGVQHSQILPQVKLSLTAQTVLSSYQLKGYVLKKIVLE